MPATYTEAQIRAAIETVLSANTTNAVVFSWWALGHRETQWPALLKNSSAQVHGYVITRSETEGERKNPQCVTREFSYDIWGFHFYDDAGTNAANSDLTFNTEIDAICNAFEVATSLPPELQVTDPPQFRIDLNMFGGELLHYAVGRLIVRQL